MHVLVVNAGSSSLKMRLLDPLDRVVAALDLGQWAGHHETEEIEHFVAGLDRVDAVGHRIVHGGTAFHGPTVIDADVRDRIAALSELAPLHQPRGVAGIDAIAEVLSMLRPLPASTPPFTTGCPKRRRPTPCPAPGSSSGACGAMASTAFLTPTPPAGRPNCSGAMRPGCGS